jgi:hypothetical protein
MSDRHLRIQRDEIRDRKRRQREATMQEAQRQAAERNRRRGH